MVHHAVEISDANGKTLKIKVSLPPIGVATWEVMSERFLRLQKGVVDKGKTGASSEGSWIACYGSPEIDDKFLVLHLDDFFGPAQVNRSGTGKLYNHDNLLLVPGVLKWRIAY